MRRSDVLPPLPPRFVVLRLAVPSLAPVFVSPACPTPADGPGAFAVWPPRASCFQEWKRQDLPSSWRTLVCLRPALRPRRDWSRQALERTSAASATATPKATRDLDYFGAQSHGLGTRCLRFVPAVTHGQTQDSLSAVGQTLRSGIGYPQGSDERFRECSLHPILLSQASLGATQCNPLTPGGPSSPSAG
jgi:hypothetical protein